MLSHTFRETTRLRRALGDEASAWGRRRSVTQRFVFVREVELVPVRDDKAESTPILDFESFVEVYSEVDVLWLSSSVFIGSHAEYGLNDQWESSFSVSLCTKAGDVKVCVYTLSPSEQWQQAQNLSVSFLRDLMKDFPVGFLSYVNLWVPSVSPTSLVTSLISMLPCPAVSSASQETQLKSRAFHAEPRLVMVGFSTYLDREKFDAVLSHPMIPNLILDVPGCSRSSAVEERDRDIRLTNDALRESMTLRHAMAPDQLVDNGLPIWDAGDAPFTVNPRLESLEFFLDSSLSWTSMFLRGVSRNPKKLCGGAAF
jgi:hypothetical protein